MSKTGLVVTTYNSENWFDQLYQTIPFSKLDECVVVNGGDTYKNKYDKHTHWIQHQTNSGACKSRIDGIKYLKSKNVDHIFIVEDDMLIKHQDVFDVYVDASVQSGLKYFCFCSDAPGTGLPGRRTPKITIEFPDTNSKVCFYSEMNNEFTYHRSDVFDAIGYYDCSYKHLWDVEYVYRLLTSDEFGTGFRYFPDIHDSDQYVMNLPESINNSRTNADNQRDNELAQYLQKFEQQHGYHVARVPVMDVDSFKNNLKTIYNKR